MPRTVANQPATLRSAHACRACRARSRSGAKRQSRRGTVTVNLAESPLSWLHAHGHLSDRQLLAGEKLRGDYERACAGTAHDNGVGQHAGRARQARCAFAFIANRTRMLRAKQRFDGRNGGAGARSWRTLHGG
jgi:hypothetical protein